MHPRTPASLTDNLLAREKSKSLRRLREFSEGIDLSSNDYLGLARVLSDPEVVQRICEGFRGESLGATGSRLVTGTKAAHTKLEEFLAHFHGTESALLFGSGYEANLGLLSSLGSREDTVIYDEYSHASMRDGVRLSLARSYSFRHNDLDDLKAKLASARGERYIVVESVYSMDGDCAPLTELCDLADEVGAFLVVDEAHATGIYGPQGRGYISELGLDARVFARVHTFGKALGFRGACVLGSRALRDHLINCARPFIYSTAPDMLSLRFIHEAYVLMAKADDARRTLHSLVESMQRLPEIAPDLEFLPSRSPIQGVVVPGNERALEVEQALLNAGYFSRAIRAPTVTPGRERIRICLHSFNSLEEIMAAVSVIAEVVTRWGSAQ